MKKTIEIEITDNPEDCITAWESFCVSRERYEEICDRVNEIMDAMGVTKASDKMIAISKEFEGSELIAAISTYWSVYCRM